MQLLLIRHAKAEERDENAKADDALRPLKPDALRPLTPDGKQKMRAAAKGLRRLYPKLDLIATSPLKRAVQTAKILAAAYHDKPEFLELDFLSGGQPPSRLVTWAKGKHLDNSIIALVGHETALSRWAAYFLTGKPAALLTMKKGSVCVIEFPAGPAAGKGVLAALYPNVALR